VANPDSLEHRRKRIALWDRAALRDVPRPRCQHFGGNDRARATPRRTHGSSWRFVRSPSPSTRSQPSICRPRISTGWVCAPLSSRPASSELTRTISLPRLLAATAMAADQEG
jgi:hypothetical protein